MVEITACVLCPRAKKDAPARWETRNEIINGYGDPNAPYMMVLEAPSQEDNMTGELLSGSVGAMLMQCLRKVKIDTSDCYFVPANRCWSSWATRRKEQEACLPYLLEDINEVKPRVIVALGNGPLWSLLQMEGITKQRGSIFPGPDGIPIIPTLNPGSIFHSATNQEYILADLAKARRVIEGDETPELGEYVFASTVEEAEQIRDYLVSFEEFSFDFETSGFNYLARDAHILCAAFSPAGGEGYVIPLVGQWSADIWTRAEKLKIEDILRDILTCSANKIAANGKFDCQWSRHVLDCEVTNFNDDAQLAFANIHEERPHSLEYQRTIWTNMPRYEAFKDDAELKEQVKLHGYAAFPTDLLWPYAAADADCTIRVFRRVLPELIEESLETNSGAFMKPRKALLLANASRMA